MFMSQESTSCKWYVFQMERCVLNGLPGDLEIGFFLSSIPRQICRAIARWQDCSVSVPLHCGALCYRALNKWEGALFFHRKFLFASQSEKFHLRYISYSATENCVCRTGWSRALSRTILRFLLWVFFFLFLNKVFVLM